MSRWANILHKYHSMLIATALMAPLQSTNHCPLFDHALTIHESIDRTHKKALLYAERNAEDKAYQEAQEHFKALLKKNRLSPQEKVPLKQYLQALTHKRFGLPHLSTNALNLVALIKQFRQRLGSLWEPFVNWAHHELDQE